MQIWRLQELGDPIDQLAIMEESSPKPGDGEVLVDVEAVAASRDAGDEEQ